MSTTPDRPTPGRPGLSRRRVLTGLLGAGGTLLVAACSSTSTRTTAGSDPATTHALLPGSLALAGRFNPNTFVIASPQPQRAVVSLLASDGSIVSDTPETVPFRLVRDGQVLAEIPTTRHDDGVPIPYYPVSMVVPAVGTYSLETDVGGQATTSFVAIAADQSPLARIGAPLPIVDTPTATDARGVTPICTKAQPCPMHELNLTDAIAAAAPVALLVSTPRYCQIGICGPVLDLLLEARAAHPHVQFIHAEVFRDPESGSMQTTPVIDALGMDYEPALFFVDADGIIAGRIDNVFDRVEINAGLALLPA